MGAPRRVAYVPVWREIDGMPALVIIHETNADPLAACRHLDYVCVARQGGTGDGVSVRRATAQRVYRPTSPARLVLADITDSLLTMWVISELTEWMRMNASTGDVSQQAGAAAPAPANDGDLSPQARGIVGGLANHFAAGAPAPSLTDKQKEMVERGRKAYRRIQVEKNGKPH
jgi:hypothetical protein